MNNPASNFGATPAGGVCIGGDPTCPCQDGDVCHYVNDPVTETAAMDSQEIPEAIHEIFQASNSVEIKLLNEHSCYLTWGPMEFRFRRNIYNVWEWDEIVGECFLHVEMMDKNFYWMGLTLPDGRNANIDIGAKRAPVRMTGYSEE